MGCGCHSAKKAQPVRQTVRRTQTVPTSPIVQNTYRTSTGVLKKRIIRRTISH